MKTRRILTLLAIPLLIAAMFSCNNGVAPLTEEERAEVLSATMTAFTTATAGVGTGETSIASPGRAAIKFSGDGFTISGTYDQDNMDITITFTSYDSMSVIINGTVTMSGSSDNNFETVADLSVIYNGGAHTLGWQITYSNGMVSGNFVIDGSSYTYPYY